MNLKYGFCLSVSVVFILSLQMNAGETSLTKTVEAGMHENKGKATEFNKTLLPDNKVHDYDATITGSGEMEQAAVTPVDAEMRWKAPTVYSNVTKAIFNGDITLEIATDNGYFSKFNGKMKPKGGGVGGGITDLTWSFFGKLKTTPKVEITKYTERMLLEGKFHLEPKATPEDATKYNWSISGSGNGKFKPKASDEGKTEFAAKKITTPNAISKIKVSYSGTEDEKDVKITKVKFAKYVGHIIRTGTRYSKFIYGHSITLEENDAKVLFDVEFYYKDYDQEKKFIGLSKPGGAWVYNKEILNNFSNIFNFGVTPTDTWKANINGMEDTIRTPELRIGAIPGKKRKNLKLGETVIKFDLTWLATVEKMQKHKESLFSHGGFAKVTTLERDPDTNEITKLGIGFAYKIVGAL